MTSTELPAWLARLRGMLPVRQREFNLVGLLKPRETQLNGLLGEMLDPRGTHGLGDAPLRAFLGGIGHPAAAYETRPLSARIRVEAAVLGGKQTKRFVDVTVELLTGPPSLIYIENKPWAGEQEDQLEYYGRHVLSVAKEHGWLVFLPPRTEAHGGWRPTSLNAHTESELQGRFRILPYADEGEEKGLISLLFEPQPVAGATSSLETMLSDIATYLRRSVLAESREMRADVEALADFLIKPEDMKIAARIGEAWPSLEAHAEQAGEMRQGLAELTHALADPRDWEIATRIGQAWPSLRAHYLVGNLRLLAEKVIEKNPRAELLLLGNPITRDGNPESFTAWPGHRLQTGKWTPGEMLRLFGFRHDHWPRSWFVGFETFGKLPWTTMRCGLWAPLPTEAQKHPLVFDFGLPEKQAAIVQVAMREAISKFPASWNQAPTRGEGWWPAVTLITSEDDLLCRPLASAVMEELADWFVRMLAAMNATQAHWPHGPTRDG